MSGTKRLHVAGFDYVIDDGPGDDIEAIVDEIRRALTDGVTVQVPVLDASGNRMTLYLNGAQTSALVLDLGEGPKPGEISP